MDKEIALKILRELHDKALFSERTALETLLPELAESEDERIRKELIDYHRSMAAGADDYVHEAWIAWLEKQGDNTYSWKLTEEQLEALDYAYNSCPDTEMGNYVEGVLETLIDDLYKLSEKQGEQKPSDKVEPKFKVGDWVVYYRNDSSREILYVYDIRDGRYYFNDNIHFSWSIKECDEKSHLWTIADAKDGDVLVEDSCIFIIQKLGDNSTAAKTYCTLYNDGDFDDGSILYFDVDSTKPATKEQRDTLMKAMADAEWEFDFEKKELKKIKQKPTWSEEDSFRTETLISVIKSGGSIRPELRNEFVNWLKSLKDRIGG